MVQLTGSTNNGGAVPFLSTSGSPLQKYTTGPYVPGQYYNPAPPGYVPPGSSAGTSGSTSAAPSASSLQNQIGNTISGNLSAAGNLQNSVASGQTALYAQQQNQQQQQDAQAAAAAGLGNSPWGASQQTNAMTNFNTQWLNSQLARQEGALTSANQTLQTTANIPYGGGGTTISTPSGVASASPYSPATTSSVPQSSSALAFPNMSNSAIISPQQNTSNQSVPQGNPNSVGGSQDSSQFYTPTQPSQQPIDTSTSGGYTQYGTGGASGNPSTGDNSGWGALQDPANMPTNDQQADQFLATLSNQMSQPPLWSNNDDSY